MWKTEAMVEEEEGSSVNGALLKVGLVVVVVVRYVCSSSSSSGSIRRRRRMTTDGEITVVGGLSALALPTLADQMRRDAWAASCWCQVPALPRRNQGLKIARGPEYIHVSTTLLHFSDPYGTPTTTLLLYHYIFLVFFPHNIHPTSDIQHPTSTSGNALCSAMPQNGLYSSLPSETWLRPCAIYNTLRPTVVVDGHSPTPMPLRHEV